LDAQIIKKLLEDGTYISSNMDVDFALVDERKKNRMQT
jgi:hypothetical protein